MSNAPGIRLPVHFLSGPLLPVAGLLASFALTGVAGAAPMIKLPFPCLVSRNASTSWYGRQRMYKGTSVKRKRAIRLIVSATACTFLQGVAMAETINFDHESAGSLPTGWEAGVTGRGSPKWTIEKDDSAPSPSNVLRQSGNGTFPWCVKTDTSIENGSVEVKFKPIAGSEDAAGGLIWRRKDGNNYYVARANALENNVSLYHTTNGRRITIKYVDAPVAKNQWHTLKVEFAGKAIRIFFDGRLYIEQEDNHISGAGAVGVWTKADSVTSFDDFAYASLTAR